ncbi:predicted protein [Histoplasma capsulatum var. duboisii H88]|uniref:Predicted protein n=2 Tax=Ajellomyces capsulatus TaxID=5037 RepID=F0U9Y1_AJEC8|nr:predicted protein [Histoplasma capsulatum H143]EGC43594.1 predicted protein [Histoplasma capsulatum var. duboisii H88]
MQLKVNRKAHCNTYIIYNRPGVTGRSKAKLAKSNTTCNFSRPLKPLELCHDPRKASKYATAEAWYSSADLKPPRSVELVEKEFPTAEKTTRANEISKNATDLPSINSVISSPPSYGSGDLKSMPSSTSNFQNDTGYKLKRCGTRRESRMDGRGVELDVEIAGNGFWAKNTR